MAVTAPRPPRRTNRPGELAEIEALREQLLIEEARRRARRRRRRYLAVVLLASAVGAVVGFGRDGGERSGNAPGAPASPSSSASARSSAATALGAAASRYSDAPSISADGRFVAFDSHASNLVARDTNGRNDAFVRDLRVGKTTRVSMSSRGREGYEASYARAISVDGRFVVFSSYAWELAPGGTCDDRERAGVCSDVLVRDRARGKTELVSASRGGIGGNGGSGEAAVSADGRFVAFSSDASNLVPGDTNRCAPERLLPRRVRAACRDVFVRDRARRTTERISVSSGGMQANNASGHTAISADGRFVAFASEASNLVAGDTNNTVDVFVRDRVTGKTQRVSVGHGGRQGNGASDESAISADGRFVAFSSDASNLVAGDTNNTRDVFVHDRARGYIERVSVSNGGKQANAYSSEVAISGDAQFVAFSSYASNLVAGDTRRCPAFRRGARFACLDVFVRDRATGKTELVSVSRGGGQPNDSSLEPSISTNGRFVAFASAASNLVPGDMNKLGDIFVRDRKTRTTTVVTVARQPR